VSTKSAIILTACLSLLLQTVPASAQQQTEGGAPEDPPTQTQGGASSTPTAPARRPFKRPLRRALQKATSNAARKDNTIPDIKGGKAPLPFQFDQSSVSGQALNLILNKKVDEAKALLQNAYQEGKKSGKLDPEIPYFIAAIDSHYEKYGQSIKYLTETQSLCEKMGTMDPRTQVLLTKRLADCHYKNHDLKQALAGYNAALFIAQKHQTVPPVITAELLESICGCETYLKEYDAAEKHCRTLIDCTKAQVDGGGIPAVLSYSWALLQMSEILKKAGKQKEFLAAQDESHQMMNRILQVRSAFEAAGVMPDFAQLTQLFKVSYVRALDPKSPAEIAWAGSDFRIRTLPVITWRPKGPPTAAIVCIHGLGLENRAFTNTAKKFNEKGYAVSAIDVRGFGAWVQTRGEEELDYEQCLEDIECAVKLAKKNLPGVPVFVLGESMGGAIALRAAAKLGKEISGVISSVPSAERFQQKKMSLQTAMHFIIDPNRAFDIGDYVAERATSEQDVRDKWAKDPNAKLDLTPIELMKFSIFMRTTKRHAEQIKDVPVLILQGLKDRLVKPKGTFELFDAVNSEDKSMIVQGLSEHLMFESPRPDDYVIDVVDYWLKQHIGLKPEIVNQQTTP